MLLPNPDSAMPLPPTRALLMAVNSSSAKPHGTTNPKNRPNAPSVASMPAP